MKVLDVLTDTKYNQDTKKVFHDLIKLNVLFDEVDELEGNEYIMDNNIIIVTTDTIQVTNQETNETKIIYAEGAKI